MTNWMFVSAAFTLTWAALIGYYVHIQRAVRRARELAAASRRGGGAQ